MNKIPPICRFYRAPELLLGARDYGVTVDVWSLGCVLAEMALLRPLLEGEDTGDQLAVIVELLGPPSEAELAGMGAEDSVLASAVQLMQVGRVQPCHALILCILVWSGGGRGRGAAGRPAGHLPRPGAAGGGRHAGVRPGRQVDSCGHHAAPRHQETRGGVSSAAGINNTTSFDALQTALHDFTTQGKITATQKRDNFEI